MKLIGRIISSILIVILILLSTICLLSLTMLSCVENALSTNYVKEVIKSADYSKLIGNDFEKEIQSLIEDSGIPKEYVNDVLQNEELKDYVGTIASEAIDSVLKGEGTPNVTANEVENILSNSFNQVINELEKNNIDVSEKLPDNYQEKVNEQIKVYAPKLASKINESKDYVEEKINESSEYQELQKAISKYNELISKVKRICQYKYILVIITIVVFSFIVLLRLKKLKFLKYLCMPFLISAICLKVLLVSVPIYAKMYYPIELDFIKDVFDDTLNSIYKIWSQYFHIYLILSIILIVVQIIAIIYLKKKNINKMN